MTPTLDTVHAQSFSWDKMAQNRLSFANKGPFHSARGIIGFFFYRNTFLADKPGVIGLQQYICYTVFCSLDFDVRVYK